MSSRFVGRRDAAARTPSDELETQIGVMTNINGELKTDGNLQIDGLVEGSVVCAGSVTVGPSGRVLASITAQQVTVAGSVKGNVQAELVLKIASTGKLWGDIVVGSLLIEEGGLFRGQCTMKEEVASE